VLFKLPFQKLTSRWVHGAESSGPLVPSSPKFTKSTSTFEGRSGLTLKEQICRSNLHF